MLVFASIPATLCVIYASSFSDATLIIWYVVAHHGTITKYLVTWLPHHIDDRNPTCVCRMQGWAMDVLLAQVLIESLLIVANLIIAWIHVRSKSKTANESKNST